MDRFNKNLTNKKINLLNVILITSAQDISFAELAILNLEKLFCICTELNTYYKCNSSGSKFFCDKRLHEKLSNLREV